MPRRFQPICTAFPPEDLRHVRALQVLEQRTRSDVIRRAVRAYVGARLAELRGQEREEAEG